MLAGTKLKRVLGELPLAAELDWALRGRGAPGGGFKLEELRAALPESCRQVQASPLRSRNGHKALIYATLHYWISQGTLLSLALTGLGHEVALAYSPYANWKEPVSKFDLRRREAYTRNVLKPAEDLIATKSFGTGSGTEKLPPSLADAIVHVSVMDTQYTLQIEEVDKDSDLFQLRLQRNQAAAAAALAWLQAERPDVVILPNGLILEFGAVFHAARYLNIPVVSYEFGEQHDRIWLSRNTPVMLQETDALWQVTKDEPFSEEQRAQVQDLFSSRQEAGLFRNFYRRWQNLPSEGADAVRAKLNLDERQVVLLAANVIGDSLTLGRASFTGDMSTWLRRTLVFFAERHDVQFVLRVHPGERNLSGPSVADLVRKDFPVLPSHLRVVAAEDPVNTYDLIALADLGLVYTTTVGMEMAMSGSPVIVAGRTHYRGKGFTQDPVSWEDYFSMLEKNLANLEAARLQPHQVDMAWHYAYRFFFDYPQPFPWHLLHFWKDVETTPLSAVFSEQGQARFGRTFDYLLGETFAWEVGPVIDSEREVKRQVREFYDRVGWKEVSEGVFQNARYEDLRPVSQEYIHRCHQRVGRHLAPTGRLFLDAGSGPIQYPEYMEYSKSFTQRVCADISITALKAARERIGAKGAFVVSDISHLPFAPDAFDAVVSLHTIHHLPASQHEQAYAELYRVLAAGRQAAVVNGWDYSPLNQFFDRIKAWLKGRKGVAPVSGSLPEEIEMDKGTYVNKQDARWLKNILRDKMNFKILVWRSASTNVLRFFIREEWLGKFWLRALFALEELFPRFFGEKGLYPLVVLSK